MGYDLHITRAPKHWGDNQGYEISPEEWHAIIDSDPEFVPHENTHGGHEHFVWWKCSSDDPGPWFDLFEGNVRTKGPDTDTIAKMLSLAERLNARVQGDDAEIYLPDGRIAEADGRILPGEHWR